VLRYSIDMVSNRWWDVYTSVESAPIVGSGLKVVSQNTKWLTEPVLAKVKQVSDPWVECVDENLKPVYQVVDEKVIAPAKEKGEFTMKGMAYTAFGSIVDVATVTLSNRYDVLVDSVDEVVEYWIPPSAEEENDENCKSLSHIAWKAKDRVSLHVVKQFAEVREYSQERLQQIIPVDLIEYAKNLPEESKAFAQKSWNKAKRIPEYTKLSFEASFYYSSEFVCANFQTVRVYVSEKREILLERLHTVVFFLKQKVSEYGLLAKVDAVVENAVEGAENLMHLKISEMAIARGKAVYTETEMRLIAFYQSLLGDRSEDLNNQRRASSSA